MKRKTLTANDRKELRDFKTYLKRTARGGLGRMMTEERWQRYVGLSPKEAWQFAKAERAKRPRRHRG
jgi:hypothetical protein